MPYKYLIYNAVSRNSSSPIVMTANLQPPDQPTGGTLQTAFYDASVVHLWCLLPIPNQSGLYVLQNHYSGLYAYFGAAGDPITLSPFAPFDDNFFVNLSGGDPFQTRISNINGNLFFKVAGSSYTPPAPIVADPGTDPAQGLSWFLVPNEELGE